jgi:hypothetical protein
MTAAETYAARVDAVLAQRTRLRGPQPPGDLFGGLPPGHPLMLAEPHRPLEPVVEIIASYLDPDDVVVDAGGGAGRINLPLALRCREIINVEPSAAMGAGFTANAARAGITNVRLIEAPWPMPDPPTGTVALATHVTYLTRDIVPFIRQLEAVGPRRVIVAVNNPPPPTWSRLLYRLIFGEEEELVPGHVELVNVLWELGLLPEVRVVPRSGPPLPSAPGREAALALALNRFAGDQWALWPLGPGLEARALQVINDNFDDLFAVDGETYVPRWITPGNEVVVTWSPARPET